VTGTGHGPADADLRAALERELGPLDGLAREPSPSASTARLERVRVRTADGRSRDLVLKSGGRDTAREVAAYRDVLAGAGVGTAALVAGSTELGWLLLDHVPGRPLWTSGDLGDWCATARWLAQAHARLAPRARALGPAPGDAGAQLARAVARDPRAAGLRRAHQRAVAALRRAPRTVVHGELFPSNVLLTERGGPCVVDWETAGEGAGLLDLAALTLGWPPAPAHEIARSYGGDLSLLPAARLVVSVRWLGEPAPAAQAGGGRAARTDWWAHAEAAAREAGP
jgi:hypothetical protein